MEDVLTKDSEAIRFMKEFTEIYENAGVNICLRETRCLERQTKFAMLPPLDDELLVGRRQNAPIGFSPQSSFESVGYYCDEPTLRDMIKNGGFSDEENATLERLIEFWRGKTTVDKVHALYTPEQMRDLTHECYRTTPGTASPLYRMSGSQMNPEKLLSFGIGGLKELCESKKNKSPDFYEAEIGALDILKNTCLDYSALCEKMEKTAEPKRAAQLNVMADDLGYISELPPATFRQAVQLAWLFYLLSGTFNYGRMDDYLGEYYARDINTRRISEQDALDLIKCVWKMIERRGIFWDGRVILGGCDRKHPESADRFALAAMEASRQVRGLLPQLTLRCYRGMDRRLYKKALDVIGEGTTFPMLYNDEVNIPSVMSAFGVDRKTAEKYVPFGCGEYVIYGQSFGTPSGTLNLLYLLNDVIYGKKPEIFEKAESFEEFYLGYKKEFTHMARLLALQEKMEYDACAADAPFSFFSLMFDDCLERGKPVFDGGIRYLGGTLETYGNINTSDSLAALKKVVFDEKLCTKKELQTALSQNFRGYEKLREKLIAAPKYGNDDDRIDSLAARLHCDVCGAIRDSAKEAGLDTYLAVLINNSMNTTFGLLTGASPDGREANTYMANANNPVGGMDKNGITAMLSSLLKLRTDVHAGAVQNMRFSHDMFGPLRDKMEALLEAYFNGGGAQSMITVLGRGDLEAALEKPELYGDLIVRVGGFSARFVELERPVQLELISRTLY